MLRPASVLVTVLSLVVAASLSGCGLIDERLENCPEETTMDFTMNLVSNMVVELDDKLGSEKDRPLRAALEDYLKPVFVSTVHEVDLSFYDQRRRHERTVHQTEVMDAEQKVFSVRIPASDYMLAGVANLSGVPNVSLHYEEEENRIALVQSSLTKVSPQATAIYSARRRMLVQDAADQHFDVYFHMVNAAAALVLNHDSCEVQSIRAEYEGLADSFRVVDSAYSFDQHAVLKTDVIDVTPYLEAGTKAWVYDAFWTTWTKTPLMVCSVGFPSPDVSTEVIGTAAKIWTINLYVTLADGSTTRSDLYIGKPLQAAHLMIIKGWLLADGSFSPNPPHKPYPSGGGSVDPDPSPSDTSTVCGVSVRLNWDEGLVDNSYIN